MSQPSQWERAQMEMRERCAEAMEARKVTASEFYGKLLRALPLSPPPGEGERRDHDHSGMRPHVWICENCGRHREDEGIRGCNPTCAACPAPFPQGERATLPLAPSEGAIGGERSGRKLCADCEAESRTGTGAHGMPGEKCWCPCHGRGDGVAVPMPGYYTPNTCGVRALEGWERCARGKWHDGHHESGDGLTKWVTTEAPAIGGGGERRKCGGCGDEVESFLIRCDPCHQDLVTECETFEEKWQMAEQVIASLRAPQPPEPATEERRDHAATGGNRQAGPGAVQTSQKSRVHADARPSLDGPATEEQPERKRTLGGMTHEEWAETWRDEPDVILRLVAGDGFLELLAAAFRTTGEGEAQR
jgi:hypothetical protein